jgi:putative Ca2+/H+ antiporter (TMEM165/GDT1 family)
VQSSLLIFVSEIGDKTFFIAGLLAAKYGRSVAFIGALGALTVMTVLSTVIGQVFHAVPASLKQGIPLDDYVAVLAFAYFGIKTLMDARNLPRSTGSARVSEEQKEAEAAVALAEERARAATTGVSISAPAARKNKSDFGAQLLQTFSLVFAAEIGDRSFLSTIALSAALNPIAVAGGAILAHAAATGVAVLGGELMSKYLSERTIGFIGGTLFLVFAFTTAWGLF